jgi:hypothetical protein
MAAIQYAKCLISRAFLARRSIEGSHAIPYAERKSLYRKRLTGCRDECNIVPESLKLSVYGMICIIPYVVFYHGVRETMHPFHSITDGQLKQ